MIHYREDLLLRLPLNPCRIVRNVAATLNNLMEATITGGIFDCIGRVAVDHCAGGIVFRRTGSSTLLLMHKVDGLLQCQFEVVLVCVILSLEYELLGGLEVATETAADGSS
jgi:hypothetical protein